MHGLFFNKERFGAIVQGIDGNAGHINADSQLDDWEEGQGYLLSLILGPTLSRVDSSATATKSTRDLVALRARSGANAPHVRSSV